MKMFEIITNKFISLFYRGWSYAVITFSQEGEDVVLNNFLDGSKIGFYIDIGAHHPFRFSNTYFFYRRGWRGINIDATPGSMVLFKKYRPRDINIEAAVANKIKNIKYYLFDESALNSFSSVLSRERDKHSPYKIQKTIQLQTTKLSTILDKYMPKNTKIDFLSIDVEGYEHEVITSNNWQKFKPSYILIEFLKTNPEELNKNKTFKYLQNHNYSIIAFTGRTVILKKL
ncbi:hypothetical protein A2356_02130 [Candidatus Nomurabacteria bacterium RIFOXYB1_FULL_39_16]|uniref:Methyltransferase FkbM domain-containing protein n=1 Tax=Candidatus Nomurabacteria bacterium RIFOXYB1_FULL_39_16 TaxID=1801803 RepID=A0A1F6YTU1_9BACT|nr:MAG: hypothetical protein A2356_02130 [Candidatus Nomurabacteria bacterium RIFOXYB1_FULL_39_16]OGJ13874.1 MAG: hypothetical protein A2585_01675 [Candidatus Nomurabacteria bacterium RIFOXYD1_FULL_39_12]